MNSLIEIEQFCKSLWDFQPKEDITPFELANCVQILILAVAGNVCDYGELIKKLNIERHFVKIKK